MFIKGSYIGIHACVGLLEVGYKVASLDNLSNSSVEALKRVKETKGNEIKSYERYIADFALLDALL